MLKVGIIGSGFGLYGLLPAFNYIKDCQVICICGKQTDRLLRYCEDINLKNIYSDWKEMLENEELDAVALAVTPNAQYEIAKVAIEKKINIFAEKPLAANYEQARELLELASKNKIIHTIDFIFPEIEEWQKVKTIIDEKTCGKLRHISVNWDFLSYDIENQISTWKTKVKEGGGALSFYFSHALYYLEYYAGEVLDVKSKFSYSNEGVNDGEIGVDTTIKFKNGITGDTHIYINNKDLNRHQVVFTCEKAIIVLENNNSVTEKFTINVHNENTSEQLFAEKTQTSKKDEDERVRIVKKIATRFVKGCINKKQVLPSFVEGFRVQSLIGQIRKNKV